MPFDWNEYIKLGRELSKENDPACLRAGISRAYYGIYNLLRINVGHTTRYKPHKDLIDKLAAAEKYDDQAQLSKLLEDLKQNREEADYDGILNIDQRYSSKFWIRLDKALQLYTDNL